MNEIKATKGRKSRDYRPKVEIRQTTRTKRNHYTCKDCPWIGPGDFEAVHVHLALYPYHVVSRVTERVMEYEAKHG